MKPGTSTNRRPRATVAILTLVLCGSCGCEEGGPDSTGKPSPPPGALRQSVEPQDGSTDSPGIHLTDVTKETGIDFRLTSGALPSSRILEVKGGGVALLDHDNDGDLDVFVPNGATLRDTEAGPGCRLFENRGNLRFLDVTAAAGLTLRRWAFGVAAGDYDGDGFDDLYVACYGRNVLLRNTGSGGFVDATESAGAGHTGWSTGCAFGDIDQDGDLDLYVVNYLDPELDRAEQHVDYMGISVMKGPHGFRAQPDVLYENRGDGTFLDVSDKSGCRRVQPSYGLNVAILDFNADGRQDILVANDSHPNFLLANRGAGRFRDLGVRSGVALNANGAPQASMGLGIADVDGNGYPDIFSTNFSSDSNTLHLNLDGKIYTDRTRQYGLNIVGWIYVGWACGFHDLDHDGDEDLLLFNGHVFPEAATRKLDSPYEQPPLLFERQARRFVPVSPDRAGSWLSRGYRGRTAAFGDLDGDGDVDIVFSELNGPLRVLRNDAENHPGRSWLIVELRDERPGSRNRRGLGARVELATDGRKQNRWMFTGGSFQASNAPQVHFGLREKTGRIALKIIWPDGFEQRLENVNSGKRLIVRRTGGQ